MRRLSAGNPWTLVVLAAGVGRRYGGPKQLESVGPSDETLTDYAIWEAIAAGAGRVVFVIRNDLRTGFEAHYGPWRSRIGLAWTCQDDGAAEGRSRPWGTTSATLTAVPHLTPGAPAIVINADDFYGPGSIGRMAAALADSPPDRTLALLLCYPVGETLSPAGGVFRAAVKADQEGRLREILELAEVRKTPEGIRGRRDAVDVALAPDTPVSMNLWGLFPGAFPALMDDFREFRTAAPHDAECQLPESFQRLIAAGRGAVRAQSGGRGWLGITWPPDRERVRAALAALALDGTYPPRLRPAD